MTGTVTEARVLREQVQMEPFHQHASLAALLVSTGDASLLERSDSDGSWGDGEDGRGRNMLGLLLMELRLELRERLTAEGIR